MTRKFLIAALLGLLTASPALPQALNGVLFASSPKYEFIGWFTDSTSQTTYTFTVPLGNPSSSRVIAVTCSGSGSNRTLSSSSINGVSATSQVSVTGSANATTFWITAAVPGGNVGVVSVTWSGSQARTECAAYALYGVSASAVATTSLGTITSGAIGLTINVLAGDILLSSGYLNTGVITVDGVVNRYTTVAISGTKHAGGDYRAIASDAARAVTFNLATATIGTATAVTFR